MARISTYQHDAMPHAEDNVIGTNQSPGHANETVLFSLDSIQELFRNGTVFTQDIDFGSDLDGLPETRPADFNYGPYPSWGQQPTYTLEHNFGTDNIDFRIFILADIDGTDHYVPLEHLPDTRSVVRDNTVVYQIDQNNLFVQFPAITARFRARIIILG